MIGTKKLGAIRAQLEKSLSSKGETPIEKLERQIIAARRKGGGTKVMEELKLFLESGRKQKPMKRRKPAAS